MQRRRLPLGLLICFALLRGRAGKYYPPRIRKEAISWKTHFPGVANVVKVIWFRSRISVARELPLSTRPGSALIPLACTISRSVMVISSLTNPLATGHFIRIAAAANKVVRGYASVTGLRSSFLETVVVIRQNEEAKGMYLYLLPFILCRGIFTR